MTNLTLHTSEGSSQALAILLVSDYLQLDLKLNIACCPKCCKFKNSNTKSFPMLQTQNGLIESTSSILRYLVRTASSQTLYNEENENIGCVDQNLDLLNNELFRDLVVLQNNERMSEEVDKKNLNLAKQRVIGCLKVLNGVFGECDLSVNLGDFVLFVFLGSLVGQDVKRSLKGLKNLKKRWEVCKKDERFAKLLAPYANRAF